MRTRPHVPGPHGPWWLALALLVLALPWRVFGATYYVATTGSNSNSCAQAQNLATPKQTIGGGAGGLACASAGDTVQVRGGTYNERVTITRSGSAGGGYITLQRYPNETPVIDGTGLGNGHMVVGKHIAYFILDGFWVKNFVGGGICFHGASDHVIIRNNRVSNNTFEKAHGHAICVRSYVWPNLYSAQYITIEDNYVHDCVNGRIPRAANEAITLSRDVSYFLVQRNRVERCNNIAFDLIGRSQAFTERRFPNTLPIPASPWPRYGVVQDNVVQNNSQWKAASAFYIDGAKYVVSQRNLAINNRGYGFTISSEERAFTTEYIISRFNTAINNTAANFGGAFKGKGERIRVVHNTLYSDKANRNSFRPGYGNDWVAKNNIVVLANGQRHLNHYVGPEYAPTFDYNLYYPPNALFQYRNTRYANFSAYQSATGEDAHSLTGNPLLADPAAGNVTLQAGSPAIDAGSFLTYTTSGGTGTVVPVQDAKYFSDGYGMVAGDRIRIGPTAVQVTAVNYTTNTLTVTPSLTWSADQPVSYLYAGSKPDLGSALEVAVD